MKEKDILRFEGPLGTFFLREDSDKPIIFVASGTGFAPVKSILEHIFHVQICAPMNGRSCFTGVTVRRPIYIWRTWQETGSGSMTTLRLSRCYPRHCRPITGAEGPAWCIRPCCRILTTSPDIRYTLAEHRQWLKPPTRISLRCAAFRKRNSFPTHSLFRHANPDLELFPDLLHPAIRCCTA